jgi:hypothetical protein
MALVIASGCTAARPTLRPESLERQRERAVRFDPYPESDVGPDIVGGRPPGYQRELPEPERAPYVPSWMR